MTDTDDLQKRLLASLKRSSDKAHVSYDDAKPGEPGYIGHQHTGAADRGHDEHHWLVRRLWNDHIALADALDERAQRIAELEDMLNKESIARINAECDRDELRAKVAELQQEVERLTSRQRCSLGTIDNEGDRSGCGTCPACRYVNDLQQRIKRLEAALERIEDEHPHNCTRRGRCTQTVFNERGGTCWWDEKNQRLLSALPADACAWCAARVELAKKYAPVAEKDGE